MTFSEFSNTQGSDCEGFSYFNFNRIVGFFPISQWTSLNWRTFFWYGCTHMSLYILEHLYANCDSLMWVHNAHLVVCTHWCMFYRNCQNYNYYIWLPENSSMWVCGVLCTCAAIFHVYTVNQECPTLVWQSLELGNWGIETWIEIKAWKMCIENRKQGWLIMFGKRKKWNN